MKCLNETEQYYWYPYTLNGETIYNLEKAADNGYCVMNSTISASFNTSIPFHRFDNVVSY
jgi:hypothetical protein